MKDNFLKGFLIGVLSCGLGVIATLLVFNVIDNNNSGNNTVQQGIADENIGKIKELPGNTAFQKKYNEIITVLNKYFLNADEITAEKIADGMYKGMIDSLGDKYAAYFAADEYKDYIEKYEGQYGGLGAYVSKNKDTGDIVIVNPFKNSPAEKSGIKAGDILLEIGGESVAGKELDYAVGLMKGEAGTTVKLKLRRDNKEFEVDVVREMVDVPTVAHKILNDEDIGYIYVATFDKVTLEQFNEALADIESKGCKGLIIDIRDNGGGRLDTVVAMANRILSDGMIMYTETRNGIDEKFTADAKESYKKPMAVLINGYSASSSEVFAGAMQDRKVATIVGTKSFGKGVVQSIIPLQGIADGSAVKLTTSKYYIPSGKNIDGIGITPDIEVEYDKDKSEKVGDETRDNQLQEAIKAVKEKIEDNSKAEQ